MCLHHHHKGHYDELSSPRVVQFTPLHFPFMCPFRSQLRARVGRPSAEWSCGICASGFHFRQSGSLAPFAPYACTLVLISREPCARKSTEALSCGRWYALNGTNLAVNEGTWIATNDRKSRHAKRIVFSYAGSGIHESVISRRE